MSETHDQLPLVPAGGQHPKQCLRSRLHWLLRIIDKNDRIQIPEPLRNFGRNTRARVRGVTQPLAIHQH